MIRRALVVSTRISQRATVARVLQSLGYSVELAGSQKRALELAEEGPLAAAIIVSGSQLTNLAQKLRRRVPRTIVLDETVQDIEERVLEQLPHAVALRHQPSNKADGAPGIRAIEQCSLDLGALMFRDGAGRQVRLTRAEAALLGTLMDNSPRALSREQLRHAAFGRALDPYDRSIDMLVARLRRKIGQDPKAPQLLVTVPGLGYQFIPPIRSTGSPETQASNSAGKAAAEHDLRSRHTHAERRQLTAICCSLGQAAKLAGDLDPEDFNALVRRFHNLCASASAEWGGQVISSPSSDVIAIFGHPHGHEDDAERAVHAGLAVLAKAGVVSPSDERLEIQIGIATSLALIGQDQSVVGEAILLAPRLGDMAPCNSIVVSERTRKLLGNVFASERLGAVELKGLAEPVTIYQIRGKQPTQNLFYARRAQKLTTFVGRKHELEQLTALWERTKSGRGQVALVTGEPGIGKSRFCEAFLENIVGQSHYVLRHQCSPYHSNTPFYPVINELEHAARFEPDDSPDTKRSKLETLLASVDTGDLDLLPFITLLSLPARRASSIPEITPQRQRGLTIAALIRWVVTLAHKRPVVSLLADAHWIDDSTLELLTRCIASITNVRVLLLVNFRPDFFPRWLDQPHVSLLHLGRLSRDETGTVIRTVAEGNKLPDQVYSEIITKADGVPLFAEELTQSVLESGMLADTADASSVRSNAASVAIPATLLASLIERLDRLGPDKDVAQTGAVIGREFSYRLLAAIAPIPDLELQSALARLAAADLIFVRGNLPDTTYVFKHALVQDAAYATMVRSKREQLHGQIAVALLERFPRVAERQLELLANHFAHAGLVPQAVEFLEQAARRAMNNSASVEVIRHLTRALELLASRSETRHLNHLKLRLEVMLAQAMITRHGYAAQNTWEALLRSKQTLASGTGDLSHKFSVLYGVWASHYVRGDVTEQKSAALEFLAEAEQQNDAAALCVAHRAVGTTYFTMGEFDQALPSLKQALALYDAKRHTNYRYQYGQDIGVAALCYLSWTLWQVGYADQALKTAAEAINRAEEAAHPHTVVYGLCHARVLMDVFRRRHDQLLSCAGTVVSICTENGFSHWISCGRILQGWAEVSHGEMQQGREKICAAVLDWKRGGAQLWLPSFLMMEAQAHAKAGDGDAALRSIEEALAIAGQTGERWALAEVLRTKARLLQEVGRSEKDEIETILINSLEIARRQGARIWELRTACDLACIWQTQGHQRKGLELLESIYDHFTEGFDTVDLQEAAALIQRLRGRSPAQSRGQKKCHSACNFDPLSRGIGVQN
jgi:predicted ATPase/class 3 adenylate cyclase/DNA-binding response OmpR family regulator